jgi:glycosyltransferase involved in cell wall biosynthesis
MTGSRALAVVIPTFNRATALPRAIASVLRSQRSDIEILVVDDASTDDTPEVLQQIRDPRLHVIRIERRGNANVARNAGIAASSAPILAFLDSDDEFLPGRCERLIALFEREPGIDAVLDSFVVGGTAEPRFARQPRGKYTGEALARLLVSHTIPLTNSAVAARRSALEEIGFFDPTLARHQDRDLLLRLARAHIIALGTGLDVIKNQSKDSFSRSLDNYVGALDALVARHPIFSQPRYGDLLAYLSVRAIVAALFRGRLFSAAREAYALSKAEHLPRGVIAAMSRYNGGREQRRRIRREIMPEGEQVDRKASAA